MAPFDVQLSANLPTELMNLLALHSSFLTALALHYAHNGTATPADLRSLTASITSVWGKRRVTVDDVRLCVGVLGAGPHQENNPFYLSDYGTGKVCLEIRDEILNANSGMIGMGGLNEDALQNIFMESLDHLWKIWTQAQTSTSPAAPARTIAPVKRGRGRPRKNPAPVSPQPKQTTIEAFVVDDISIAKFLAQLPLAEITLCSSAAAIAPLRETGRKRLREVQESVQAGRRQKRVRSVAVAPAEQQASDKENEKPATDATNSTNAANAAKKDSEMQTPQTQKQLPITAFTTGVRKTALLDRILAKQSLALAQPTLSTAELNRKAALQRSEEVLSIISLLAANRNPSGRVSFSMASLLQSLAGSLRSPLSKDEVLRCVQVLADEVCPGYVSVVRFGSVESVVVNGGMRWAVGDVRGRVALLGGY